MPLSKPAVLGGSSKESPTRLEECSIGKRFPLVAEFLSLATWADGTPREPGSMTIFLQDGLLKACLRERSLAAVSFLSGNSLSALFQAVEKGLKEETLDWRAEKPSKKSGTR